MLKYLVVSSIVVKVFIIQQLKTLKGFQKDTITLWHWHLSIASTPQYHIFENVENSKKLNS
jgi:hypothetical protein